MPNAYIDRNDDTSCELEVLQIERIQISARTQPMLWADIIQLVPFENLPPEAPAFSSARKPSTADDLAATASSTDPNGDEVSFSCVFGQCTREHRFNHHQLVIRDGARSGNGRSVHPKRWLVRNGPLSPMWLETAPLIDTLSITPTSITTICSALLAVPVM